MADDEEFELGARLGVGVEMITGRGVGKNVAIMRHGCATQSAT